ncbi:hypothetical protein GCM10009716_20470 [Streptomyces sodiiphilus]|uniref:Uncharacterized protein n=1 Tax=Streptomyces sodiiphilus TaxID=226217 RepID=A0ABN2P373_9ACTN
MLDARVICWAPQGEMQSMRRQVRPPGRVTPGGGMGHRMLKVKRDRCGDGSPQGSRLGSAARERGAPEGSGRVVHALALGHTRVVVQTLEGVR